MTKIVCATNRNGCGQSFHLTEPLLERFKQLIEADLHGNCPNCERRLTTDDLRRIVAATDKLRQQIDDQVFPLAKPVIPAGRRKNGSAVGIDFRAIANEELESPPSEDEIRRVRRFFARGLEDGIDCPCCTRHAQRQYRPLGCGPARWLIELVYLSDVGQPIHTGEILKNLAGHNVSGSDATSVLPLYGLIEPAEDPDAAINPPPPSSRSHAKGRTAGYWRPTKLGRAFALNKITVPERVVTCLGTPEAFDGPQISIRDALGKKFNYDELRGRGRSKSRGTAADAR